MFFKGATLLLFVQIILGAEDPIAQFKKWNDEVDQLTKSLGEKNKKNAELMVDVFNSDSDQSRKFIKETMVSFNQQAADTKKYQDAMMKQIEAKISSWTSVYDKDKVTQEHQTMINQYLNDQKNIIYKKL